MKKQSKTPVSRKPNKIIEARQGLSVVQHRILFAVLSKFRTKIANTELKTPQNYLDFIRTRYEINLSDIIPDIKKMEAGEGSALYKHIDRETNNMMKQIHEVQTDDGWKKFTLIDFAEFHRKEMKLEIKIAESMIFEILTWYKSGYTQIPLKEVIPLRSKYSIRIFELLLRVVNIPDVKENGYTISYEELRQKLGIPEKEYKEFIDFKKRILSQAQKEIHEKTFLRFGYEKEKNFFTGQLNVRFFDIVHKVKEILPMQTTLFNFEKMEENNDQQVAENSKKILDYQEELYKQIDAEKAEKKNKKQKRKDENETEEDKMHREIQREIIEGMNSEIHNRVVIQNIPRNSDGSFSNFTAEEEKKLEKYLEGIFSAEEIKSKYEFDYIEFYYQHAVKKNDSGFVKDFAAFFYKLLQNDKLKFYELKEKKKQQEEEKIAKEKLERERKRKREQEEKEAKEREKEKEKRVIKVFDDLNDENKKIYLEKLYSAFDFYRDFDKENISDPTKYAIGKMIIEEQAI